MPLLLKARLAPYMAPAADVDAGGGLSDAELARARGDILDDDTPTEEPAEQVKAEAKDEGDEEPAEETKAEAKDEGEEEPPKPERKPVMIPKARFDDARRKDRERIKQLEEQLARAAQNKDAPPSPTQRIATMQAESDKLMADYVKALDEGDTKKAAEVMTKVRQIDRDIVRIESAEISARDRAIAVEQVRLDTLIDQLEEKYPQLREGTDEYDEDLVAEITDLRAAFEARGYASSDALRRAVKYALRDSGESQRQVASDVDSAADKADKAVNKAKQVGDDRRAEAVRRNLKVMKNQPFDTNKAPGLDSHKAGGGIDLESVAQMSEKDFDALPEATKRKLRGDFYAPTV